MRHFRLIRPVRLVPAAVFALLALCAALLAGCSALSGYPNRPEVSLSSLQVDEVRLFEQRFRLLLRVRNPNDRDLPVEGLEFTLDLNGEPLARGQSAEAVSVPRQGEAVVTVFATSDLNGWLKQFRKLRRDGDGRLPETLPYRLKGTVSAGGLGKIPFTRDGEVPVAALLNGAKR
ncbi:LEA type 2 family protein [Oryzomicrobium sp.]|uniref:LEA type 2 family protein n=1 Tax=Oryzomicrobium sp. TaxID=1911578 RepID=UPI0025F24144|nr:LEA type 2 family protein [Oryzomicrobium sp.]MCE1244243.1 LEA type 2 family protein [Oryzomicrobium sp.]